ncbi:MAG TPA: cysteine--tRNA ligase, partial [Nocardioides sp.]|nr:cysteine--tRNA ligase [Nocardioides sp.]
MTIRLYDTATREVRDFVPLQEGKAGLYVCGLTVQSEPHVGHVRSAVNFDVLQRWLRHRGYEVTFIRNITDIDDKILAKSAEQGRPWYNLAYAMRIELDKAYAALNVAPPTYEPAATGHIPEMIVLIERLIERGHAYPAADGSGDVYFDVRSWSQYGELTHQGVDDMEPAADADPRGKRDPRDFALWKGRKDSEPATASWPSPWGPGRPGWHIECSAMAEEALGVGFEIHGGGNDLTFPHHENEAAQTRMARDAELAQIWMHNGMLQMGAEKMAKSVGNVSLLHDVLATHGRDAVIMFFVGGHYRGPLAFDDDAMAQAGARVRRVREAARRLADGASP